MGGALKAEAGCAGRGRLHGRISFVIPVLTSANLSCSHFLCQCWTTCPPSSEKVALGRKNRNCSGFFCQRRLLVVKLVKLLLRFEDLVSSTTLAGLALVQGTSLALPSQEQSQKHRPVPGDVLTPRLRLKQKF